jgi:hypothetical protein
VQEPVVRYRFQGTKLLGQASKTLNRGVEQRTGWQGIAEGPGQVTGFGIGRQPPFPECTVKAIEDPDRSDPIEPHDQAVPETEKEYGPDQKRQPDRTAT